VGPPDSPRPISVDPNDENGPLIIIDFRTRQAANPGGATHQMKLAELIEAIDLFRKAGWVEPPITRGSHSKLSKQERGGRASKNGGRKRGRPRLVPHGGAS
jgi:hypothetical protein